MTVHKDRRLAFLYDYFQVNGGAEKVAQEMQRSFTDLKLITSQINPDMFAPGDPGIDEIESYGKFYNTAAKRILSAVKCFYFNAGDLKDYDVVFFSGFYSPLAVRHHPCGRNIYYCHTPPRFLYDLKGEYESGLAGYRKLLFRIFCKVFEGYYVGAIKKMDLLIANSENVRGRIKKYIGLDAEVVYPPVNPEGYQWGESQGYYLSTARLEPYKRVDKIISAFLKMPDKKLIVASGGSDMARLKSLAESAPNIKFTGWCTL